VERRATGVAKGGRAEGEEARRRGGEETRRRWGDGAIFVEKLRLDSQKVKFDLHKSLFFSNFAPKFGNYYYETVSNTGDEMSQHASAKHDLRNKFCTCTHSRA